ncbi:MAG TPA: dihydrofolate reductase family protein [Robiginitalea sp.]|nr:dihydrofolate reductase family protein [Robiginitalea sp.]
MEPASPRITLHMVSSLDGFIAKKDNSVGWFETASPYEKGMEWQGPGVIMKNVDCYVMGATTYEHAVALSEEYYWAYGDTPTVVVTHRDLPKVKPHIEFFAGDLGTLVKERLRPRYKTIWVVGGAALANDFLRLGLADEIRLAILPILLGEGLPFFDGAGPEQSLQLLDSVAYNNGLVELVYEIKKA